MVHLVNGQWSYWTPWSSCLASCNRIRTRICDNPPPKHRGNRCLGVDSQARNCTGGMCRPKKVGLLVALGLAVTLLVTIALATPVVIWRRRERKKRRNFIKVDPPDITQTVLTNNFSEASTKRPISALYSEVNAKEGSTWASLGPSGGRLQLAGVTLTVAEGSLEQVEEIFLSVCRDERPIVRPGQTILGPVIELGPSRVNLKKPVVLSFEHCASLKHGNWRVTLCSDQWAVTVGEETETPLYVQMDAERCHVMTDCLRKYTLLGEPTGKAVKLLKVVAFSQSSPPDYNVRLYVVHDTQCALEVS
ncbi:DgyrCDS10700 [Dimorphilus gyrociliatus]|uniref:DgyrCDS10700 n=1 Tax=Dimorphilus gyrociliatus TaxID=2664684 RepID=A0A7I8W143_9ANNE|nr:DgyrCDS10700 [Dimorphilus gyrociliatus]